MLFESLVADLYDVLIQAEGRPVNSTGINCDGMSGPVENRDLYNSQACCSFIGFVRDTMPTRNRGRYASLHCVCNQVIRRLWNPVLSILKDVNDVADQQNFSI